MQKLDDSLTRLQTLNKGLALTEESQREHSIEGSESRKSRTAGHDHIDVINQMFAEFELAYHNQYHKAYAQEGSVNLAKKYWLTCLNDLPPETLLRATRKVVSSQEFLPTVASIIKACDDDMGLFGLPTLQDAYVEACCAPNPKSDYKWSHPAVYLAGKATGWFELAEQSQAKILPLFEYHYHLLCAQVLKGEKLEMNAPKALPSSDSIALSATENQTRLSELRKSLEL